MRISNQQLAKLRSLRCHKLKDIDPTLLNGISGPVVKGKERAEIINLFRDVTNLTDENEGVVSSYVILSPEGLVLSFFSIRCGELFKLADTHLIQLATEAREALKMLMSPSLSPNEQTALLDKCSNALKAGLGFDDIETYAQKGTLLENDKKKEPNESMNQVLETHPGIELKFLGVNEMAKPYWKSLGMKRKMGETLFYFFVIPILTSIQRIVGVKYLYLFAADEEAEGDLVNYYKNRLLHIDETEPQLLSANKPLFDSECRFLYQSVKELEKQRRLFFEDFNPDAGSILV